MRYLLTLIVFIISSSIIINPLFGQDNQAPPPPGVGWPADQGIPKNSKAPDFRYQSLNGKEISLSNLRGQFVLIDFWGTWCKPCLEDTPHLKEAYSKFGNEIEFIGIAVNNRKKSVIDYVEENSIVWPQIFVPFESRLSADIVEAYNVRAYPSLYLIDPKGNILLGAQTRKDVDKLRGEKLIETLDKVLN